MSNFDAVKFAAWLEDGFLRSSFKSYSQLADRVGVTRSTISSLAKARLQTATGKPSRPKAEMVVSLAEALGRDVDDALMLAGHAPIADFDNDGLFSGLKKLSPEKQRLAKRQMKMIIDTLAEEDDHDTDYIGDE